MIAPVICRTYCTTTTLWKVLQFYVEGIGFTVYSAEDAEAVARRSRTLQGNLDKIRDSQCNVPGLSHDGNECRAALFIKQLAY